ncbi:MAG TPA: electron transfer flavoprotein subunit alpha/FixB family protein [Pseudonocardiaceae bacterium]
MRSPDAGGEEQQAHGSYLKGSRMKQAWIVSTDARIAELRDLVKDLPAVLVAVGWPGEGQSGFERVIAVSPAEGVPVEASAPAVVRAVTVGPDDVVVVQDTAAGRVLAGALAASLQAPILQGITALAGNTAEVSRFGGISVESVTIEGNAVLVVEGSQAGEAGVQSVGAVAGDGYDARVTGVQPPQAHAVDLAGARRIVGAGRGFKEKTDLALAEDLAAALGAAVACSRPVAEGQNWLPRDRYLGVSGQKVAPDLYLAAGISGELQHMAGVRGARVIVAVNSDPQARIFKECDYGIVGDLYEILPRLTDRLKSA